jgi:transmembrane sensor
VSDRFEALAKAQDEVRARTSRRGRVRAELLRRAETRARAWWPLPAVAIAIAVVVAMVWRSGSGALTFEHGPAGDRGVVGAWLAAPAERDETLRFSDGSEIDLHPRTRARVAALESDAVSVVLEAGSGMARIESGASRRWHVHAGPYRVEVTGTRFAFAWDPASEAFDLQLEEGTVLVTGPGLDGEESVRAGERLHVAPGETVRREAAEVAVASPHAEPEPREQERVTTRDDATTNAEVDMARAPTAAPRREHGRTDRARVDAAREPADDPIAAEPAPPLGDSRDAWRELAAAARYRDALVAAEDYGLASLCESSSARDLLQLADVARFARAPTRAIEVLRAVRRRFPESDAAAVAAFERGRIANASGSAYPEAAKWFATYLREAERGPLAREALARLMEAQAKGKQHAEARATAQRYLERFPNGPDADVATRLAASSE